MAKDPNDRATASSGAGDKGPAYKPFQLAQEAFVSDLGEVWNDVQRRLQDLQFEFARSYGQAAQTQFQKDYFANQKEFQTIQDKFRKDFESLTSDPSIRKRCRDAYTRYQDSVKKAVAQMSTDDMDPATLSLVGQSMLWVAQVAGQVDTPCLFGAFAPPDPSSASVKA